MRVVNSWLSVALGVLAVGLLAGSAAAVEHHLFCHSHDDLGWLETIDDYYKKVHKIFLTTIEGLESNGRLAPIQQAFIDYHAVQCGFCTPGVIMSAQAILNATPDPSEDDISDGLAGVLCRCTGHIKVKEAIRHVGEFQAAGEKS